MLRANLRAFIPVAVIFLVVMGCAKPSEPKVFNDRALIMDESVVLKPGEWRSWPFTVKEKGQRINGSYSTLEEKDFDILFYVTDPASKDSLQTENKGRYNYKSLDSRTNRHMTSVLKDLDPGEYFLLFHNESTDASRTVKIRMYLEY